MRDDAIALLTNVETATLGHLSGDGFMAPWMQQLHEGPRVCGPALTVSTDADDGSAIVRAIAAAKPGDILVIERRDDDRHACWGAVLTAAAQGAGIAGVVIDGFVTDAGAIRAAGLPVWCKGRSPLTTKAGRRGGSFNEDIRCAGVTVRAGDLILADENGVCVLDPEQALRLAGRALQMQAGEPELIASLAAGKAVDQVLAPPAGTQATDGLASMGPGRVDGAIEVPVISDGLRRLGSPVSAVVRAGNLLFTCGMPPLDPQSGDIVEGDIGLQTDTALDALDHTLRHAGASLRHIVKVNVFITDAGLVPRFNETYRKRILPPFPARTTAIVCPWPSAFDIEIECVALT